MCKRYCHLACTVLLMLVPAVVQAASHALLIGIADYSGTGFKSLAGPHNDVNLVRGLLIDRFGVPAANIRVLLDGDATHTGLADAFAALAARVRPGDSVYIHYAGHGSDTRDLNGDEPSGLDQTWVSYGARSRNAGEGVGQDSYDVLDDEIQAWLAPILAKTDDVVFVSDSCHSASVTRGESPLIRAIPGDARDHPLGHRPLVQATDSDRVIRIGAAGDNQSAIEIDAPDKQQYGMFTWYWVAALESARPGTTWREAFQQASSKILVHRGDAQRPQMEGVRDRDIFGGDFQAPERTVAVKKLRSSGKRVILDAGLLNGTTMGSVYHLQVQSQDSTAGLPRLKITETWARESMAEVLDGKFAAGDLVVEESHVYPYDPVPVFVNADFPDTVDRPVLDALKRLIARLPGYREVGQQAESVMVLYVLRPQYDPAGKAVYRDNLQSLPVSARERAPEVWVLTPAESLLHENLKHGFANIEQGLQALEDNLRHIARVREVRALGNVGGGSPPIGIEVIQLEFVQACPPVAADACFEVADGAYRISARYTPEQLARRSFTGNENLTFRLTSHSLDEWYVYLLDIRPDGKIKPLYPRAGKRTDDALLGKARTINLLDKDAFLFLRQTGEEVVKVIMSRTPIDINLLTQEGYRRRERAAMNPLEHLLAGAMQGTRGSSDTIQNNQWGTLELSFQVTLPESGR